MNAMSPEMLAEVLREIEAEKGHPDKYSVPIEELFRRLIEKGYRPGEPTLH
jgi:hypothetical protein